jgi:D-alanyl-lipoteichoic acid acyltransferase DltB (MBOAT superfamily)
MYWQGFYLYAIQIYADFSGYTDIARASASLLGFDLPENFHQPYLAPTIAAFWDRWHMSLTGWFREYLFFPLSRAVLTATRRRWARWVQTASNLITMALIGLWHGAAWTFLAWGTWHGALLSVERASGVKPQRGRASLVLGILTFHLVGLGWILFRAESFAGATRFIAGMASLNGWQSAGYWLGPVLLAGGLTLAIDFGQRGLPAFVAGAWPQWRPVIEIAGAFVVVVLMVLQLARGSQPSPFIYGQF